ncbi:hypothetical protein [Sandarakinorhabdus glacialis]|nr:hypothetical protein [Polymorphobacter glacialis]
MRPNRNGWTASRQAIFIDALADTASVTQAALRAGMSRQAANWLRRHPAAHDFRLAWDAALTFAWQHVEASALERVINGETETIERDGVVVTRHRPCSPRLLTHMVDRAVAGREKSELAAKPGRPAPGVVEQMREAIRALGAGRDRAPDEAVIYAEDGCTIVRKVVIDNEPEARPARPANAGDRAVQALDDLTHGFTDQPGWEDRAGGDPG